MKNRHRTKIKHYQKRLLNLLEHPIRDFYHWLWVISWAKFFFLISLFFLLINFVFAFAYFTIADGIANAKPGSFSDAFFFSVQTLSTIGYGAMYPQSVLAQILVTIEVLIGLILVTTGTGLIFARFARPQARILFSNKAVICPFDGIPTLMFRVANQRNNRIIEARIQVSLLKTQVSQEGIELRRLYDLQLLRSQSPSFRLSWLVMHPIDETSPLYGVTTTSLAQLEGTIIVILTGLDETFSQTIHSRYLYYVNDLHWSMRFVDVLYKSDDGSYTIDYQRFHEITPL
jgi:inward rectifier potassium channel